MAAGAGPGPGPLPFLGQGPGPGPIFFKMFFEKHKCSQTYVKQVNLNQFNNNNNSSSSSSSNNINNSNNIIITVTIVVTEISETVLDMGKEITCVNMVKFKENKTNTTTDRILNIALADNQISKSCQVVNNCENAIFIQCKTIYNILYLM